MSRISEEIKKKRKNNLNRLIYTEMKSTQAQFANLTDFYASEINDFLSGERTITDRTVSKIMLVKDKLLPGLRQEWLLAEDDYITVEDYERKKAFLAFDYQGMQYLNGILTLIQKGLLESLDCYIKAVCSPDSEMPSSLKDIIALGDNIWFEVWNYAKYDHGKLIRKSRLIKKLSYEDIESIQDQLEAYSAALLAPALTSSLLNEALGR